MDTKNKKQKVQMPASMRKKLMAATSMLLVSAIMLVSSSYAWFTLSTAPEVTGITTSVGANGNLEIALLTTDTFADMTKITSGTADSMSATNQTLANANITWGNLVDLNDAATYGWDKIDLYPAALNTTAETAEGGVTTLKLGAAPLSIPVYGADGRVESLSDATSATGYNVEDGVFSVADSASVVYGVRAVGTSSGMSARQIVFKNAVNTYNSKANSATNATSSAVRSKAFTFLSLAMSNSTTYEKADIEAMQVVTTGIKNSLNAIVNAYANAGVAIAAAENSGVADTIVTELNTAISSITDASVLKTKLNTLASITTYDGVLTELATAQEAVDQVNAYITAILKTNMPAGGYSDSITIGESETQETISIKTNIVKPLIGDRDDIIAYNNNDEIIEDLNMNAIGSLKEVYLTGGAIATVANYTGKFLVISMSDYPVKGYACTKTIEGEEITLIETGKLDTVTTKVNDELTAPSGSGEANLTDFYGYIMDFAFRTNATGASLQLQTDAVNRVYSTAEGANLATQGAGSKITFTYEPNSGLTAAQAEQLLNSIKVVFFDPQTNVIHATAMINDIQAGDASATGTLKLMDSNTTTTTTSTTIYTLGKDAYDPVYNTEGNATSGIKEYAVKASRTETVAPEEEGGTSTTVDVPLSSVNCTNYKATLSINEQAGLAETTTSVTTEKTTTTTTYTPSESPVITGLTQNQAQKVSVLVFMDGENIDNAATVNAASSGNLQLNLQFSSSVPLTPMKNTTLMEMEKVTP